MQRKAKTKDRGVTTVALHMEGRQLADSQALIAVLIRDVKDSAGLTFQTLGERLGIKTAAAHYFASGRANPTITSLAKIANAVDGRLKIEIEF